MTNPLQDDYERFPLATRAQSQGMAAVWKAAADEGLYDLTEWEQFWAALQPAASYLPGVIDAQRESDGKVVGIKWVRHAGHARDEVNIMRFLSSYALRDDPQNHCNPLLDVLPHPTKPNDIFLVTPWLAGFVHVPIITVNEVVDMVVQLTEGLVFMHKHNVAHRDCTGSNIMQDVEACFPGQRTHPVKETYSTDLQTMLTPVPNAPRRYYFIDFGVSSHHEGAGPHLVTGLICRDRTAPELSPTVPYDPFKLDIYLLGHHFLEYFVDVYSNMEFLRPVLTAMVRPNPLERPTAQQALDMLLPIARQPFAFERRWRIKRRDETWVDLFLEDFDFVATRAMSYFRSPVS
ncbi:hypothetical protein AURDEDRAFT_159478 [Auricularia subglabra TFB-10046 SS5]|nr:hypothetical protein AURDEDRAFT_159478 [Auricularia subglabra TFB-10046 SS5]